MLTVAAGVVTDTLLPLLRLPQLPNTAVICVALLTVKEAAAMPPTLMAVAQLKLVPVITMLAPGAAVVGEKELMVGAAIAAVIWAVPPGVVTQSVLVAPQGIVGTTAVAVVVLNTVNDVAAVEPANAGPKLTAVTPPRLVPVINMVCPAKMPVGENDVMVGVVLKTVAEVPVPAAEVTAMVPVALAGTTAEMLVALMTVNDVAAVPPKLTAVAPVKFVPVKVIVAPVAADVGVNEVTVGADNAILEKVAVPPGVVTETLPAVPLPTTAVIDVALTTLKDVTGVPPKLTAVAPVKLVPVIVIVDPIVAGVVTAVTVGARLKPARVAVPPGVVTDTLPVVDPAGTTAVMLVGLTTVYDVAVIPPKLTAVAPVKLVPVIETVAPEAAVVGVNAVTVGAAM